MVIHSVIMYLYLKGENVLSLINEIHDNYLGDDSKISNLDVNSEYVFLDLFGKKVDFSVVEQLGLITICYPFEFGISIYITFTVIMLSCFTVQFLSLNLTSFRRWAAALIITIVGIMIGLIVGIIFAVIIGLFMEYVLGKHMSWFSEPLLGVGLFGIPFIIGNNIIIQKFKSFIHKILGVQKVNIYTLFDILFFWGIMIILSFVMLLLTYFNYGSGIVLLYLCLALLLPRIFSFVSTPKNQYRWGITKWIELIITILLFNTFVLTISKGVLEMFIPITDRAGANLDSEVFIAIIISVVVFINIISIYAYAQKLSNFKIINLFLFIGLIVFVYMAYHETPFKDHKVMRLFATHTHEIDSKTLKEINSHITIGGLNSYPLHKVVQGLDSKSKPVEKSQLIRELNSIYPFNIHMKGIRLSKYDVNKNVKPRLLPKVFAKQERIYQTAAENNKYIREMTIQVDVIKPGCFSMLNISATYIKNWTLTRQFVPNPEGYVMVRYVNEKEN